MRLYPRDHTQMKKIYYLLILNKDILIYTRNDFHLFQVATPLQPRFHYLTIHTHPRFLHTNFSNLKNKNTSIKQYLNSSLSLKMKTQKCFSLRTYKALSKSTMHSRSSRNHVFCIKRSTNLRKGWKTFI